MSDEKIKAYANKMIGGMYGKLDGLDVSRSVKYEMWEKLKAAQDKLNGDSSEADAQAKLQAQRDALANTHNAFMSQLNLAMKPMSFNNMAATGASCSEGYHWDFETEECVEDSQ